MGDLVSEDTLSYGIEVMTPAVMLIPNDGSAPGEYGRSKDVIEFRVVLDDRELTELALSKSPPRYFPSSLTFLFSFLLLPKNDFPADDCLDFPSPVDDMTTGSP